MVFKPRLYKNHRQNTSSPQKLLSFPYVLRKLIESRVRKNSHMQHTHSLTYTNTHTFKMRNIKVPVY